MRRDASVIICTYTLDRWSDVCAAVESARRQSVVAREVIVVVDHNPELLDRARAELAADVVIPNQQRRGLSGARNTGVATATAPIVAFLDDDATAERDWLLHLLAPYSLPDVIGVGGLVVPSWSQPPPAWFPAEFGWVVGCSYTGLPERLEPVRNPIGANMSFRRRAVVSAGGFAGSIGRVGTRPMGCEETELAIRLRTRHPGAVVMHQPRAVVHHRVPEDRAQWRYFRRRCWSEGLSKAEVARLAGAAPAQQSERRYVTHTIPRAVARDLRATGSGHDGDGWRRATASVAGVAVTSTGYAVGRLRRLIDHHQPRPLDGPHQEDLHP